MKHVAPEAPPPAPAVRARMFAPLSSKLATALFLVLLLVTASARGAWMSAHCECTHGPEVPCECPHHAGLSESDVEDEDLPPCHRKAKTDKRPPPPESGSAFKNRCGSSTPTLVTPVPAVMPRSEAVLRPDRPLAFSFLEASCTPPGALPRPPSPPPRARVEVP